MKLTCLRRRLGLALAMGLLPLSATAQGIELAPNLTITGDLQLQHSEDKYGYEYTDLITDLELFWRLDTDTSYSLGLEASVESFIGLNQDWSTHALWAAAVFGFEGYDLRIGSPRPVSKTMALLPDLGGYRYISTDTAILHSSVASRYGAWGDRFTPGLSLQSRGEGPFAWGLSLHQAKSSTSDYNYDVPVIEAIGQYQLGDLTFSAQLIHTRHDGYYLDEGDRFDQTASGTSAMLGLRYAKAGWLLGAVHGRFDTGFVEAEFTRLHASYAFANGLSLYADLSREDMISDDYELNYRVVGMTYRFDNGLYVDLGTTRDPGGYSADSVSVGYRF